MATEIAMAGWIWPPSLEFDAFDGLYILCLHSCLSSKEYSRENIRHNFPLAARLVLLP